MSTIPTRPSRSWRHDDGRLSVQGGVPLTELEALLGHSFRREDVTTVGGLVLRCLRPGTPERRADRGGWLRVHGGAGGAPPGPPGDGDSAGPAEAAPAEEAAMIWVVFAVGLAARHLRRHGGHGAGLAQPARADRAVAAPARGGARLHCRGWREMEQYLSVTADARRRWASIVVGAAIPACSPASRSPSLALAAGARGGALRALRRLPDSPLAGPAPGRTRSAMLSCRCSVRWSRVVGLLLPARRRPGRQRVARRSGGKAPPSVSPRDDELIMVGGVMTFTERPVREVMTPRTDIVAVSEDDALEDIAAGLRARADTAGSRSIAARWMRSSGCCTPSTCSSSSPAIACRSDRWRSRRPAAPAATCCSTCSGSGATWPWCSTSSAAPSALSRSRTCSRNWWARSSTSTTCHAAPGIGGGDPMVFEADGSTPVSAIEERFERGVARLPAPVPHRRPAGRAGGPDSAGRGALPGAGPRVRRGAGVTHPGGAGADPPRPAGSRWSSRSQPSRAPPSDDPYRSPSSGRCWTWCARATCAAFLALAEKAEPADLGDVSGLAGR